MNDGELMAVVLSADLKSVEDKTTQEVKPNDYGEPGHWHFDLAPPPPPKATPKAAPQAPCPPPTASERWPVRLPVEGGQAKVLFQSNKVRGRGVGVGVGVGVADGSGAVFMDSATDRQRI